MLRSFTSIIFLFLSVFCFSQKVEFTRLGVNENLSQNSVHHILQDKQGFIWIATGDGLNRYDGRNFSYYRHQYGDTSTRNIPSDFIKGGMVEDSHENLWLVSGAYITCLNKKTGIFSTIEGSAEDISNATIPLWQIAGTVNDELWYVSSKGVITCYNIISKSKQRFNIPEFNNQYKVYLQKNFLTVIQADRVSLFDINTKKHNPYFIKGKYLSSKYINDSIFLLANGSHLDIYSKNGQLNRQISLQSVNKRNFPPTDIVEWKNNEIFLSIQEEGLIKIDLVSGKTEQLKNEPGNTFSLSNNTIHCLYIDRSENLWIGTEGGGVNRLDLKPGKFFSFPTGSQNMLESSALMIKSLYRKDSVLYAGTFDKGLFMVNINNGLYTQIRYPKLDAQVAPFSINILYKDQSGRLWMNVGNIIGYINESTGAFIKSSMLVRNTYKENHAIFSLLEIEKDHFLLGTNFGLYKMKVEKESIIIDYNQLLKGHFQSIVTLHDHTILTGIIDEGFKRIRFHKNNIQVLDSGMTGIGIRHIQPQNNQLVWLASDNGVVAYNPVTKKYTVWDESDGLSNSHVYAILPYGKNELWISTNKGLNHIKYSDHNGNVTVQQVAAYQQKDGLQSNEFNSGAYFKGNGNEYFFGGVTGINWFDPGKLNSNRFVPQPVITRIDLFDKAYHSGISTNYLEEIRFRHNENSLGFHFAALEFSNPKVNEFAYMLKGFDKDWIYTSTPEVRYSKLPPGEYALLLKAANNDGIWNETPASIKILISPPFWKTWWFISLCSLIAVASLFFIIKQIINNKVKNKLRAQELQMAVNEERIRISKDMHDEMGTSLTKISLLSEVSRQTNVNTAKQDELLNEITSTSRNLTEKMGEIIWTLNPKNDTLDNLCAYLKEYIYETTEYTGMDVETIYPQEIPELKLSNKQRQQLLLVTKEALHNALKHSNAGRIVFRMQLESNKIIFSLKDDGKGFEWNNVVNRKNNGKGNGLFNMQNRMEEIGGYFKIESGKQGSTVEYGITI